MSDEPRYFNVKGAKRAIRDAISEADRATAHRGGRSYAAERRWAEHHAREAEKRAKETEA